jgi:hypothetical protein
MIVLLRFYTFVMFIHLFIESIDIFSKACFDETCFDETVQGAPGSGDWVFKNKEHGMLSAVASIGMIMMWDVHNGLSAIDRFMYTDNENITAGALLGCGELFLFFLFFFYCWLIIDVMRAYCTGIVSAGIRNEVDPALAILGPRVNDKSATIRTCALLGYARTHLFLLFRWQFIVKLLILFFLCSFFGGGGIGRLGLAYAGSAREDVLELLVPSVADAYAPMEVCNFLLIYLFIYLVPFHDIIFFFAKPNCFAFNVVRYITSIDYQSQQQTGCGHWSIGSWISIPVLLLS